MSKIIYAAIFSGFILIGGYVGIHVAHDANPLMNANMKKIDEWYGDCFRNMYFENQENYYGFNEAKLKTCEREVLGNIQRDTTIELQKEDLYAHKVIQRFKPHFPKRTEWKYQ